VDLETVDLETRLAEAAPARRGPRPGPDSPAAVSLYRRITAQPPPAIPGWRRRSVGIPVGAGLAAAAAAAVALALIPGTPAGPQTAAAAVLGQVALTAASQPAGAAPGPGRYVYVKAIVELRGSSGYGASKSDACLQTVQDWAAPDGSGRQVVGPATGSCDLSLPSQVFPPGQKLDDLAYSGVTGLPANPAALGQFIVRHFEGGQPDNVATFQFAGTFLQAGARPQVRAALYRLIGSLPGIQSLGPMTDRLGRHGIGIGLTDEYFGVRNVLIFDPATSAVLEREGVVANPAKVAANLPVGAVINATVYETSGVTDSLTTGPASPGSSG
jgi:hypothetical protein